MPPTSRPNAYAVLEVAADSSLDEIRRAYHRQCLRLHPDKRADAADAVAFQRVQDAWALLQDAHARHEHDQELSRQQAAMDAAAEMAETVEWEDMEPGHSSDERALRCRCGELMLVSRHVLDMEANTILECEGCSLYHAVAPPRSDDKGEPS